MGGKKAHVLVVDDERPIRELFALLLRANGHHVVTAEDGAAGLRAVEQERFDLVITDISMPGADGWTLAAAVKRRRPETKLIIVTGHWVVDQPARGVDASLVDAVIPKPFDIATVESIINDLLGRPERTRAQRTTP